MGFSSNHETAVVKPPTALGRSTENSQMGEAAAERAAEGAAAEAAPMAGDLAGLGAKASSAQVCPLVGCTISGGYMVSDFLGRSAGECFQF